VMIPNLPKGVRGSQSFDIVFSLSAESILTVTAEDKTSGRVVTAAFSTKDTPEEVKKRLASSAISDEGGAPPPPKAGGFGGFLKKLFGGKPAS